MYIVQLLERLLTLRILHKINNILYVRLLKISFAKTANLWTATANVYLQGHGGHSYFTKMVHLTLETKTNHSTHTETK